MNNDQSPIDPASLQKVSGKFLTVTVKSPGKTVFSGQAQAVTSSNEKGTFDILPYHTNFISLITGDVIIHQENQKEMKFTLQTGIIKVYEDTVHILIGIETKS